MLCRTLATKHITDLYKCITGAGGEQETEALHAIARVCHAHRQRQSGRDEGAKTGGQKEIKAQAQSQAQESHQMKPLRTCFC